MLLWDKQQEEVFYDTDNYDRGIYCRYLPHIFVFYKTGKDKHELLLYRKPVHANDRGCNFAVFGNNSRIGNDWKRPERL